jgi:hypothetical protein
VRDLDNRQYLMFYEAHAADGRRSIGLAVSRDGNTWKRCPTPVLTPAATAPSSITSDEDGGAPAITAWDAGAVGCPSAVSMSAGRWRLYYTGRANANGECWLLRCHRKPACPTEWIDL